MAAFINVARYKAFGGENYFPLPKKFQNKKAIINTKKKDSQCLRWVLRVALFPAPSGRNPIRLEVIRENTGPNFTGIDLPILVSQIDKLGKQNPNLA